MDWSNLFTSFEGRINRAKWWFGFLAVAVLALTVSLLLVLVLGLDLVTGWTSPTGLAASIAVTALIAYPASAVMIKRLNDRDRPRWLAWVFWTPTVLGLLGQITGVTITTVELEGRAMPVPTALGYAVNFIAFPIAIWGLIELGMLKGERGANRHGADPLAGTG